MLTIIGGDRYVIARLHNNKVSRNILTGEDDANANLVTEARNALPALIAVARAAQVCLQDGFFDGTFYSGNRDRLKKALEQLK
jgi:hypothetical protein